MRQEERIRRKSDMNMHNFGSNVPRQEPPRRSRPGCEDNVRMTVGDISHEDVQMGQLQLNRIL